MSDAGEMFSDGKAYEQFMGRWSRLAGEKFLDWLDPPNGLRWIDVGCGNGAFTEVLIGHCAPVAVTGVDPSEGQLAYARTRPGAKLAQFRRAEAQSLPFPDDSFDAASMALVISFLTDPVKAATEMARVVKPGGWVATYMRDILGGGLPVRPIGAALKALGIEVPPRPSDAASTRDNMRAIWEEAGLQSVEIDTIHIPIVYADFNEFWESITLPVGPTGKTISDMSPSTREQFKARLREQLPSADGRIAYEAFANAAKGRVPE